MRVYAAKMGVYARKKRVYARKMAISEAKMPVYARTIRVYRAKMLVCARPTAVPSALVGRGRRARSPLGALGATRCS